MRGKKKKRRLKTNMQTEWVSLVKHEATTMVLCNVTISFGASPDVDRSQTYEKMRKRIAGTATSKPVPMLIGRSLVFCNLPPQQNTVFPVKYS